MLTFVAKNIFVLPAIAETENLCTHQAGNGIVCSCKRVSYAMRRAIRNILIQAQTIALNQCSTISTRIILVMCVPYGNIYLCK